MRNPRLWCLFCFPLLSSVLCEGLLFFSCSFLFHSLVSQRVSLGHCHSFSSVRECHSDTATVSRRSESVTLPSRTLFSFLSVVAFILALLLTLIPSHSSFPSSPWNVQFVLSLSLPQRERESHTFCPAGTRYASSVSQSSQERKKSENVHCARKFRAPVSPTTLSENNSNS